MFDINAQKNYSCVLLFDQTLSKSEIQSSSYNYAKTLKKLGASKISAVLKNDYLLVYPINKNFDVKFVELSFLIAPQAIASYTRELRLDESVLRFFLTVKD